MFFIYLFFIGTLIGTAMVIPGVSGSVIAVILGVYDKAIEAFTNLFKNFKKNFLFLIIIFLGIVVGAIWFSNVMMILYEKNESVIKFAFIGLILGGIPVLLKKVKKQEKEKINYCVLIFTFLLSIGLWILSLTVFKVDTKIIDYNSLVLFIAGIIYAIGKVVPGVSGSFLLMLMGIYEYILSIMAHPITVGLKEKENVVPFLIGLITGVLLLVKVINYLFEKHLGLVYSVIIGFVMGSVFALIPTIYTLSNLLYGLIAMIICFILSYNLTK